MTLDDARARVEVLTPLTIDLPKTGLPAGRALLAATRPTVTGRAVWLSLESSEPAAVDRDLTLPDTNRHPAYVVDRYRLISTAA